MQESNSVGTKSNQAFLYHTSYQGTPTLLLRILKPKIVSPGMWLESKVNDSRTALCNGFNSHYIVTQKDGFPPSQPTEDTIYDEIVVQQEYV
jgi:hypothetical protein